MYTNYVDLDQDENLPLLYEEPHVTARILAAQAIIESVTKKWFESRPKTYYVDGTGTDELRLRAPIISITSVERQRSATGYDNLALTNFAIYNAAPEDWNYPVIALSRFDDNLDVETELSRFPTGRRNIRVMGQFGWVNTDGSTPADIVLATKLLTKDLLGTIGDDAMQETLDRYGIKREDVDKHEYEKFEGAAVGKLTGNPAVDRILARYTGSCSSGVV